jgi:class I fructose-bisphosphate aldolase
LACSDHAPSIRPSDSVIVKINHNEFLSYPNSFDQILFASVGQAFDMGAAGIGATILLWLRRIQNASFRIVELRHSSTPTSSECLPVLWCYLRIPAFKTKEKDYHVSADLTGQANSSWVWTIEADIIKQKLPENNGGYKRTRQQRESIRKDEQAHLYRAVHRSPDRFDPIPVGNCYMGRSGLINSGGASAGESDLAEAIKTAIINKRAGWHGVLFQGERRFNARWLRAYRS